MCRHVPKVPYGSYAPGYHYVQTPTIIIHMLVLFFLHLYELLFLVCFVLRFTSDHLLHV